MEAICFFFFPFFFLTQPASYSAHRLRHSVRLLAPPAKCMQRLSAIVFRSNYPGDSPVPLTLPPRRFFSHLSTCSGLEEQMLLSPRLSTLCHIHPLLATSNAGSSLYALPTPTPHRRCPIPAGRRGQWKTEGCHYNKLIPPPNHHRHYLHFPALPPSIPPTLKHSHCRSFCRPIDWN